MKKLIFNTFFVSCMFLLFGKKCISQINLVSNPSFENHYSCPTFMLQWDKCVDWTNCNGHTGNGLWGTPDYYHTCGTPSPPYNSVPPNTGNGTCNPHTGGAMMGLVCYNPPYPNYREYISSQLTCPMTPGNTYTVSFWITASSAPTVKYNSSHFGVYLSNTSPIQTTYLLMSVVPQYEITTVINNTTWQQHTFTITPTSTFNHITLGCFRDDGVIQTVLQTPSANQPYSNYFIDDIKVEGASASGTFSTTSSVTNVTCNGSSTGSASIVASSSGSYTYLWSPGNYTTASVSNLSAGIYTVTVNGGSCNIVTSTISVTQPSAIVSSLSSITYTVCKGNNLILNPLISGGTPSYVVNWGNGVISPSTTISPNITSVYTYTVTDANNCTKTQSVQVSVESSVANFTNSILPCSSTVNFTNTSTGNSFSFWSFGDGQSSLSNFTAVNSYSASGTYTVSLIASTINGCSDTIYDVVNIGSDFLNLDFTYDSTSTGCQDSVFLINNSNGATSFSWLFDDGTFSSQVSPSHYFSPGIHYVTLVGFNSNCTDSIAKVLSVESQNGFNDDNKPNVFTPNGDGANDVFDFKYLVSCEGFTFEIFDRWGLSIFKSDDKKQSFWNGRTSSGEEVSDGTYFYIMNKESGDKLKGTVTVFR